MLIIGGGLSDSAVKLKLKHLVIIFVPLAYCCNCSFLYPDSIADFFVCEVLPRMIEY